MCVTQDGLSHTVSTPSVTAHQQTKTHAAETDTVPLQTIASVSQIGAVPNATSWCATELEMTVSFLRSVPVMASVWRAIHVSAKKASGQVRTARSQCAIPCQETRATCARGTETARRPIIVCVMTVGHTPTVRLRYASGTKGERQQLALDMERVWGQIIARVRLSGRATRVATPCAMERGATTPMCVAATALAQNRTNVTVSLDGEDAAASSQCALVRIRQTMKSVPGTESASRLGIVSATKDGIWRIVLCLNAMGRSPTV